MIVIPSTTIAVSVAISVVAVTITIEDPGASIAEENRGLLDVELGNALVGVGVIYRKWCECVCVCV